MPIRVSIANWQDGGVIGLVDPEKRPVLGIPMEKVSRRLSRQQETGGRVI